MAERMGNEPIWAALEDLLRTVTHAAKASDMAGLDRLERLAQGSLRAAELSLETAVMAAEAAAGDGAGDDAQ